MQAASGNRGAESYSSQDIDTDIAVAEYFNSTTNAYLPDRQEDVLITYMGINLRDQIRKNQTVPLQFVYEAADCRIFYTQKTWLDYASLWTYAANAIWNNPALCVPDSTGLSTSAGKTDTQGPPQASSVSSAYNASAFLGTDNQFTGDSSAQELDSHVLKGSGGSVSAPGSFCPCTGQAQCHFASNCGQNRCRLPCNNHGKGCPTGSTCTDTTITCNPSKGHHCLYKGHEITFRDGWCSVQCSSVFSGLCTGECEATEHNSGGRTDADDGSSMGDFIYKGLGGP